MQTRRQYLVAAGLGLAGLAGCVSGNGEPAGDGTDDTPTTDGNGATTTDPPGTTTGPTGDPDVTVTDPVVRKAVTYYSWPASTKILAPEDEQFVVATVEGPEGATPPEFALEAGGETFSPGVNVRGRYGHSSLAGRSGGSVLENDGASGYLVFRVPSPLAVDDARIVRDDGGPPTPLPDAAVATLGRPAAAFELDDLTVPERVAQPSPVDVSLTVTNASDVDGRFLAGVHWPTDAVADDDETSVVERAVGAGETTSVSLSLDTEYAVTETTDHPLAVSGDVTAERTVRVVVEQATTTAAGGS